MNKRIKKSGAPSLIISAMLMAALSGCSSLPDLSESVREDSSVITGSETDKSSGKVTVMSESLSEKAGDQDVTEESSEEEKTLFTERDLKQTADTANAGAITAKDGETVEITEEGVYTVSGNAKNFTVKVNADEKAKVQLVLDGVNVENEDAPAIYVVSADKVFVTTTDSESTLTVSGQFSADGENNTDAVIYSKDDLVLNGTGTLNIVSYYANGVSCKDDLKITGGTYAVSSALDAFEANDSILINDGTFTVKANKDGFHCENDEGEGTVTISGGKFDISAGSDGIDAIGLIQIDGGTLNIEGSEGLEATYILINDGEITVSAGDDGINASSGSSSYETAVEINGGNVNVTVGQGDTDGIDSNGSIYINGGTVSVNAQMSSFDYDGKAEFNGGTIIVNGTEVNEIPQSMMGGGMRGGRGGMNGGMFR
ncbi:carbohydrate-binding domain-containing protein [Ruminococcus sp. HUN007]|uniref:carbohydrate-binding domain-containing protein n=1 Tax=Ruminococcus sp. HUN007 TaxID=1514668 RepID=UPI0005D1FA70|nr:carbohydrate-binding domain-containing protein [Ruminococcus sp. HUN007]